APGYRPRSSRRRLRSSATAWHHRPGAAPRAPSPAPCLTRRRCARAARAGPDAAVQVGRLRERVRRWRAGRRPADNIVASHVAHEQEEAVCGLVQPAIAQIMAGQGGCGPVLRVWAQTPAPLVPAILPTPVATPPGAAPIGRAA